MLLIQVEKAKMKGDMEQSLPEIRVLTVLMYVALWIIKL